VHIMKGSISIIYKGVVLTNWDRYTHPRAGGNRGWDYPIGGAP